VGSLLVFSRDPGATEQLIAVIERIAQPDSPDDSAGIGALRYDVGEAIRDLRICSRPPGESIWRAAGYEPTRWDATDDVSAQRRVAETGAALVLTGTSDIDEPTDRALWRAAAGAGISSHVVFDQMVNLATRLKDSDGRVTFPDWAYVRDAEYAAALAEAGVPSARIRTIGNLHAARLDRRLAKITSADRAALRAEWGAREGCAVVLFVSECAREMASAGRPSPYDELAELENLLGRLRAGDFAALEGATPESICVVIRPHPRDLPGKYDAFIKPAGSGPKVTVSFAGDPVVTLAAADLVVGMNSSLLHDAKALGRPALSLTGHPLVVSR
jgi:hypothetical protein